MDVSEFRKRLLRALDEARKDVAARRGQTDAAAQAYETFLRDAAVPLFRQAQAVLKAEAHLFTVQTPAGSVRLQLDASPETFVELSYDASSQPPTVVGRTSLARGRRGQTIDEQPIGGGKAVADLAEEDVSEFLIAGLRRLLVKS